MEDKPLMGGKNKSPEIGGSVASTKAQASLKGDEHVINMGEWVKLKDRDDKLAAIESKWVYMRHSKATDAEIIAEIRPIIES